MRIGIFYFVDASHHLWDNNDYCSIYDNEHNHLGWIRAEVIDVVSDHPLSDALTQAYPRPDEMVMNTHPLDGKEENK